MSDLLAWLNEDNHPAIQYRTRTEIVGEEADVSAARDWILSKLPADWTAAKGLWYRYHITALAECGLKYVDLPRSCLDRAFNELDSSFECSCSDFMLLASLTKLGLTGSELMQKLISSLAEHQLPDGGFVCHRRLRKLNHPPKSCYKANLHALMLIAACRKSGIDVPFEKSLSEYFLRRNLFYRSDAAQTLILDSRPGWRSIDVFHPFEVMRVGIHNIIEPLSALGYGHTKPVCAAFNMLNAQRDSSGRVLLAGTLTKSYLPKERVGKPSKWATFYTLLAEKER